MAETVTRQFTVCAAFYDSDCRATITLDATDFEDACQKAIAAIDDGVVETEHRTWDPGPTFIYGVVEGDGDPFEGTHNVPHYLSEESVHLPQYWAGAIGFVEQFALLETWRDTVTRYCQEDGITDPQEIEDRIHGDQTTLDYLIGRHEKLEEMILAARKITDGQSDPVPDTRQLLQDCIGALDACMTQIQQMRGMFDDADGTIQAAL